MQEIKPVLKAILLAMLILLTFILPLSYIYGGIPSVLYMLEMWSLVFLIFINLFLLINRLVRGDIRKSLPLCSLILLAILLYLKLRYSGQEYVESANIRLFYLSALGLLIVLNIFIHFISRKMAKHL